MNYYLEALKKYVVFQGRSRRSEYWFFVLFNTIALIILGVIDNVIGTNFEGVPYGALYSIYSLGVFLPSIAVFVRRMHDTGRSGFWIFISLIPLIGAIVLLIFLVQDSQEGDNKYGPNPKLA
ncbi:DUF805 domain-containing protein [Cerasicoccus arenae]|uniref:Aminopeptidase n=1 Tax=Cerasicoccus arenae TaxID=424488 RepID=A0A8J3DGT9_9BACT|nr:DUF805 domain-containing protein [Cerasicoccus arenae]MBK1857624.1 DUF805 domain-containing protein [Cerasicoccus arenae]GHC05503.1 aminopeptidase [Cerasicoccus arenae]